MKITLITMDRLTPEQREAWCRWQQAEVSFSSPYLRPEFVQAAAAIRKGVEVAVIEEGGEPVGFFPFERRGRRRSVPVAAPLNDFQAVIAKPGLSWDAKELVRACGLNQWHFDHLLVSQQAFAPYHWNVAPSYFMDLASGFDAYQQQRHDAGFRDFVQARKKLRKAENRLGPLRFAAHTTEEAVFQALLRWKSRQYVRTKMADLFSFPWVVELLRRIRSAEGEAFAGMFSALYLGERLAAVHFGMRSYDVLHAWFPAFDAELSQYSPGMILFMELARAAPGLGIRRIDLGKGPEAFKVGIGSGMVPVAEGFIDVRPLSHAMRRGWLRARDWVRRTPLRRPAKALADLLRPYRARRTIR